MEFTVWLIYNCLALVSLLNPGDMINQSNPNTLSSTLLRKSVLERSSLQWQIADRLRYILLPNMRRKRNKWSSLTQTRPEVCTVQYDLIQHSSAALQKFISWKGYRSARKQNQYIECIKCKKLWFFFFSDDVINA